MSKGMKKAAFLLLVLCTFFLCAAGMAESMHEEIRNPAFDLEVNVGYDGMMTYGKLMPVWIRIRNFGDDLEGILGVNAYVSQREYDRYEMEISVPAGSQREFMLPVTVYARQDLFTAELVRDGEVLCAANGTPHTVVNPSAMLIGMLSTRPRNLNNLNIDRDNDALARYEIWKTVALTEDSFPEDAQMLKSFGMLVMDDIDPASLSRKQQEALDEWLKSGRILLCGGGANAGRMIAYFGGYTGLKLEGITTSDSVTDGLQKLMNRATSGKKIPVSIAEYSGADPLVRDEEGHGLIYQASVGRGRIYTAAFETGDPRLNSESLMHYFWQQLLVNMDQDLYTAAMYAESYGEGSGTVNLGYEMPVRARSFLNTGLIIVAGMLVFCCVFWWILKKKDLRQWMWAVFPAVSILAAVGILLLSSGSETNRPMAVISENLVQNASGTVQSYKSITASVPSYGRHSYSLAGETLQLNSYNYVDYDEYEEDVKRREPDRLRTCYTAGGENTLTAESGYAWDMINLTAVSESGIHGSIGGTIWMEEDGLHGEVINGTDLNLSEGYVITSYGFAFVPALAPGDKAEVTLVRKTFAKPDNPEYEEGGMYTGGPGLYSVIYAATGSGKRESGLSEEQQQEKSLEGDMINGATDALYAGQNKWSYGASQAAVFSYSARLTDAAVPELTVDGKLVEQRRGIAMLTAEIPFAAVGRTGVVFRSPGMDMPVRVETEGSSLLPTDEEVPNTKQQYFHTLTDNPTFCFTLEGLDGVRITSLTVQMESYYEGEARVYALNAENRVWEEIGINGPVKDPERYLDPEGRLYLQFRSDSMNLYADITTPLISLEGRLEHAEN